MRGGGYTHGTNEYIISLDTVCSISFDEVVTMENIYRAWNDFIRGKRGRSDVNVFAVGLIDNLVLLHDDLREQKYVHGTYESYMICDPKKRIIHKASVRDRVVHRLLYNALYPYFNKRFVYDSFSCRTGKGTHKARGRFRRFVNEVSVNYTKQCFVPKFDIRKCFESVDRQILKQLLRKYIQDNSLFLLCESVVDSFASGLPLGNLTSQLFINIYLHELDLYMKQELKVHRYVRYADDIMLVHQSKEELTKMFTWINCFLKKMLHLDTHKVEILSIYGGVDVLGEVLFPQYARLRRSTERRMKKRGINDL